MVGVVEKIVVVDVEKSQSFQESGNLVSAHALLL